MATYPSVSPFNVWDIEMDLLNDLIDLAVARTEQG